MTKPRRKAIFGKKDEMLVTQLNQKDYRAWWPREMTSGGAQTHSVNLSQRKTGNKAIGNGRQ